QFTFQIEGEAGPLAGILRHKEIRGGSFSARGEGGYRDGTLSARGRLEAHHLVVRTPQFQPPPAELSADYSLTGPRAQFPRLQVSVLGGVARGKAEATLGPRAPAFKATIEIQNVDLAGALNAIPGGPAVLPEFPLAGLLGGKLDVSGDSRTAQARFDVTIQAAGLQVAGRDPVSGYARGAVTLTPLLSLNLEDARLQTAASELSLHGQLGEQANLALQVHTTSFEEWRAAAESILETALPLELHSTATFSGTLSGTRQEPLVRGAVQMGDFEFHGWKWSGLTADVTAAPNRIQVASGRLLGPGGALTLGLTASLENWKLTPSSHIDLTAHARNTSIEGSRKALSIEYPLDGQLTGEIALAGTRDRLTGQGKLHVAAGSYAGEPIDSFDAGLSIDEGAWKVTHFTLVKGHGRVTGDASFDPRLRTLSARASGSGFSLTDFIRLPAGGGPAGPGAALAGALSFNLQAEGEIGNPSGRAVVEMRQLTASGVALGALSAHFDLKDHQTAIDGQLQGAGESVSFHGAGKAEGDWPLDLTAQYSGLRLDPWLRASGLSKLTANLDASGTLHVSGPLRRPAALQLKCEVQSLQVSLADLKWKNGKPFEIALANRKASITPFELQGPSTQFQFQGTADLGPPSNLNLTADGQIDSAFLHVFDPAILSAGLFRIQLRVQGTLGNPSLFGTLHVEKLSLGYPGLPLRVSDLSGDVDLQGDRIVVRSLESAGGPATVKITGGATLAGTPRYNLRAEFQHLRADYPVEFTSVLSGSIRLSGTQGSAALSGSMTLEQMYVAEDFDVLTWLSELENQPPPGIAAGQAPLSSRLRLDVHIGSSPVVSVDSHDLKATATVDLSLRGTLADPVAYGNVHIQSGQAVLRQTTYTISRGDIIMANPLRTAPTLDLEAKTRLQSHDLVLRVTGPADRPNISYRSDPPLPTPSILALLAFGYTNEDQLIAANGRSSLGTQSAGALLSQALSSRTSSRITRLFGLSRISIDPNPSSLGGARVTVAEQLARNFTVTYVTTTGGVYERIIQVEWDVTDNISLLGIRDQNGVYGLELDFRRRFK
ncbi:MAG TPA: translocation/assembly module TamB domain-containing protein, partial [Terriglobia bacterium]|nr:translocation/assembly module TamB domain-containing protein [Terriglobia bacterium]